MPRIEGALKLQHFGPDHATRCTMAIAVLALATLFASASPVAAQSFPNRPVHIIVGQSPGSTADTVARIAAEQLTELWQQPVAVENRPGAGGTIAGELVSKSPPDGYTLLLAGQSNVAVSAVLDRTFRYDPVADFAPVGR